MINSLDEAIKHEEEVAEELEEETVKGCCDDTEIMNQCLECASEHRQLAEWLRELKFYKDRQDLINKSWQELIRYREGIEKVKMRSQSYRECGETILASGMEQALDILERYIREVNADAEIHS